MIEKKAIKIPCQMNTKRKIILARFKLNEKEILSLNRRYDKKYFRKLRTLM